MANNMELTGTRWRC